MKNRTKQNLHKDPDEVLTSTSLQKAVQVQKDHENGEKNSTKIQNVTTI